MGNRRFFLVYLLPVLAIISWVALLDVSLEFAASLFLTFTLILFLPRIYNYISKKYDLEFGRSSKFSEFLNNIDILKEDGMFYKYYSVLYGGGSSNNRSLWILKLTTLYSVSYILIASAIIPFLYTLLPGFYSTLEFKIVVISLFLTPVILLSIHLISIRHSLFPIFIVIYSLVFYVLLLSSYLMFAVLLFHLMAVFTLRFLKRMFRL